MGKTSIILKHLGSRNESVTNTITATFHPDSGVVNGSKIDIQIWDTAGRGISIFNAAVY